MHRLMYAFLICLAGALTDASHAELPLTPGNVLLNWNNSIIEYDGQNQVVGSVTIPTPGDSGARDLTVDELGRLHIYNGTFDPTLLTLDPDTGTWSDQTALGWSTVNNGSYGGIAAFGGFVFVTDMRTFGDGGADEAQGVIRFDLEAGTWTRFAEDVEPTDLNLGLDGLLYVLSGGTSARTIDIYDPQTLALVDSLSLLSVTGAPGLRSIAADAAGVMYGAKFDGGVLKFTRDGTLLGELNVCVPGINCNLLDIDVASDGRVSIGDRVGAVTLTTTDLGTFERLNVNANFEGAFVGFVPDYDNDLDGVPNVVDNCRDLGNDDQFDADGDGFGNLCDTDVDNDCVTNVQDLGLLRAGFFGAEPVLDFNGDGVVNVIDLGRMRASFFSEPGPSGLATCAAR